MARLQPGDRAPDFEAPDQDDNTVRRNDFRDRPLFIFFYPKANTAG
jgi:peroxiredoxin Q/BCP